MKLSMEWSLFAVKWNSFDDLRVFCIKSLFLVGVLKKRVTMQRAGKAHLNFCAEKK